MARIKDPSKVDAIVEAGTWAFTTMGFQRARIHQIADRARVGPGTVYLYAGDKEALFELCVLRALESPVVAHPTLPYRRTPAASLTRLLEDCLHEVAHFPQLWVASQRRDDEGAPREYLGIVLELARWLGRYRPAILLAERNRLDRPVLGASFDRVVWTDLDRRLTGYLIARARTGSLVLPADPAAVARFTVDALVSTLVAGPRGDPPLRVDEEVAARLAAAPVYGLDRHSVPIRASTPP